MSMAERILEALRAEFGPASETPIMLLEEPPGTFSAPSVVVTPGDPWKEPATHGLMRIRWEILVPVLMTEASIGIEQMDQISDRIIRAAGTVGARWVSTSGPRSVSGEPSRPIRLVINRIEFKSQIQEA